MSGRFISPGHIGIVADGTTNGPTWFSYHYYDAAKQGRSRLAIGKIDGSDGWPTPANQVISHSRPASAITTRMKMKIVFCLPLLVLLAATGCATSRGKLVWHDEFNQNGPPDPANWNYERGFVRNHELQWYQPENAFCTNGLLVIEARREHRPNPNFVPGSTDWRTSREWIDVTSASLTSRRLREFKYGRLEMRARIDTRLGSWPAFWTLGATPRLGWPAGGEVDIMEYYTGTVLANLGYSLDRKTKWLAYKKPITELGGVAWSKQFHIWTMDWDDQKIDLRLDGQLMNHLSLADADNADRGNPFHRPVYLILNQAVGGDCGGDPATTPFPIRFEVDWVRVYQRGH